MDQQVVTLVIGASENPSRYSHKAVLSLKRNGQSVIALGKKPGFIEDIEILSGKPELDRQVDTISLYLNEDRQQDMIDYILSLKPRRIIFNPGAENGLLADLAKKNGIIVQEACTLVMLSTGQY
jgi:predicted CoA-binding protein